MRLKFRWYLWPYFNIKSFFFSDFNFIVFISHRNFFLWFDYIYHGYKCSHFIYEILLLFPSAPGQISKMNVRAICYTSFHSPQIFVTGYLLDGQMCKYKKKKSELINSIKTTWIEKTCVQHIWLMQFTQRRMNANGFFVRWN